MTKKNGLPETICEECCGNGKVGREVSMSHGDIGEIGVDCHVCNGTGLLDFRITRTQVETVLEALHGVEVCEDDEIYEDAIKILEGE